MWRRSSIYRRLRSCFGAVNGFHSSAHPSLCRSSSCWPVAGLASGIIAGGTCTVTIYVTSSSNTNTKCDSAYQYSEVLPSYGSSSDPLILPFSVEEPEAFIVPVVRDKPRSSQDEAGLEQSIRAFLASSPHVFSDDKSDETISSFTSTLLQSRRSRLDKLRETQKSKCVTTDRSYFYTNPQIVGEKSDRFVLLAGPASQDLGLDIAQCLGVRLSEMQLGRYADGEIQVQIEESVRGKSIFIVQSTESSDSIMQLFLLISTLRRASAKTITVVIPYYGYARQDQRKNQKRESIAAADIALMLEEMGMDHVLCVDVHSESILGFFSPRMAAEHLFPAQVAAAYFHEELTKMWPESFPPVTVVASHEGQVQRATHFLSVLQSLSHNDIEVAILTKSAAGGDPTLTGNVKGRVCIMIDDIVNTGTTVVKSTKVLKNSGAAKIFGWATHGVFTTEALEMLANQEDMEFFLTSNSLYHEGLPTKVRSLNIAPLLAEAIARMFNKESLKSLMYLDSYLTASEYHDRYDSEV